MTETTEQTEPTSQEASAALRAGYLKQSGGEAPVSDVVAEAPVEPAGETAHVEADPLELLRQELAGVKGQLASVTALSNEVKAGTGRIAAFQRELATAKAAATTVTDAPTQAQIDAAAKDPEKWEALKKDFEEWTQATEEFVKQKITAESAALLKRIPPVDIAGIKRDVSADVSTSFAEAIKTAETRARQLARIDVKYPTWEDDIRAPDGSLKPEFAAWAQVQAPDVQALAASDHAKDALKMLDLYYEHRKAVEKKALNQSRLASVVTPQLATTGGPTAISDAARLQVGYDRVKKRA